MNIARKLVCHWLRRRLIAKINPVLALYQSAVNHKTFPVFSASYQHDIRATILRLQCLKIEAQLHTHIPDLIAAGHTLTTFVQERDADIKALDTHMFVLELLPSGDTVRNAFS